VDLQRLRWAALVAVRGVRGDLRSNIRRNMQAKQFVHTWFSIGCPFHQRFCSAKPAHPDEAEDKKKQKNQKKTKKLILNITKQRSINRLRDLGNLIASCRSLTLEHFSGGFFFLGLRVDP